MLYTTEYKNKHYFQQLYKSFKLQEIKQKNKREIKPT